jgi:hypothetical protein
MTSPGSKVTNAAMQPQRASYFSQTMDGLLSAAKNALKKCSAHVVWNQKGPELVFEPSQNQPQNIYAMQAALGRLTPDIEAKQRNHGGTDKVSIGSEKLHMVADLLSEGQLEEDIIRESNRWLVFSTREHWKDATDEKQLPIKYMDVTSEPADRKERLLGFFSGHGLACKIETDSGFEYLVIAMDGLVRRQFESPSAGEVTRTVTPRELFDDILKKSLQNSQGAELVSQGTSAWILDTFIGQSAGERGGWTRV